GHVDHLGSAEWLRREHHLPIRAHPQEHPIAKGEITEMISEADLFKRVWRPKVFRFVLNAVTNGALTVEHVTELAPLESGTPTDVPGRPIPIHTPGHTRGHVGLHLPDRGALLSGDALITVDVWNRDDTGPQLIRPQFNADHHQAAASLREYAALEADVVVPGHGDPFRGRPAEAVEQALARL
ncbi:MAG: MBL fold metallo-hydrolase, partial [Nitriliruptorales bacterium]|nr:MBL fold metallo-hydrolase [Nitriliruptorales bacterium]